MSQNRNALLRYKVIDRCLNNRIKEYTFKDLKDEVDEVLLEKHPNYDGISEHQLRVDIRFMMSADGYDAPIIKKIKGRERIYTYESPFSISKSTMNETELKSLNQAISVLRMFEGREEFNWLNQIGTILDDEYIRRSQPIISYESNLDYAGNNLLPLFFNAILNEIVVEFDYEPFGKQARAVTFHPHYLKQYANRWYIFGKHENQQKATYHLPLDRIKNVRLNHQINFEKCSIDWDDYFFDIIGVIRYDEPPQEIILHVNKETFPFVQTKPIHPTQKIRKINDDYYEIRIKIIPNREFIALLMSYGQDITIIEPEHLNQKMHSIINKMKKNYER